MRDNVGKAITVLDSCLPRSIYFLEVVTDNAIDCYSYLFDNYFQNYNNNDERRELINFIFKEIVVPTDYCCKSGAKFKARALHYAIITSSATGYYYYYYYYYYFALQMLAAYSYIIFIFFNYLI